MDIKQIFLVIMFVLAIVGILKEPSVKIGKKTFRLDYGSAPLLAVLVLAVFGYLNPEIIASFSL